ncbi:deoxyribonuclease gamma-like isoform X1 [Brachyistius frenatus]|uniref:deoxyribonuclease gamma-like isoform X1 n=2 Tax=Brachyistius frenatus TaxID=100188 RepID=UPI0037E8A45D
MCPVSSELTMKWHYPPPPLPLVLLLLLVGTASVSGFRICSYNVQKFNQQKSSNYRLIHTLTRVVSRCDICLLQDVVDADGKAIKTLLLALNRETDRYEGHSYQSLSSKGLGNSPEDLQQYVFIYRTQTVKVIGQHQYSRKQSFVREPFVVQFQSNQTAVEKFILVPLHTEPRQAVQEIDRLYDVFQEVSRKWNNTNVMFLGDFHASCAYVTRTDRKKIRLYKDSNFSWLIGDRVDTTVGKDTNCAYDRIVVHGEPFLKAIQPFSAKVFDFSKQFKLSRTRVMEVSDHFPLEVTLTLKRSALLNGSALLLQATPLLVLLSTMVWWLPRL